MVFPPDLTGDPGNFAGIFAIGLERETGLEPATSSLESIFTNPNSESPDGAAGAHHFSF